MTTADPHIRILYRGPLSSCNYGCVYCPFAKTKNTRQELQEDQIALERFVRWVENQAPRQISVLFTPWGEALIRKPYQRALLDLAAMPHVRRAAIQTNLSCDLRWLPQENPDKIGLWATFHPEWTPLDKFIEAAHHAHRARIRISVGTVGFHHLLPEIQNLRRRLSPEIYLWINAVKKELPNLPQETRAAFRAIDPLYELNTRHYPSLGKACAAGHTALSINGHGDVRRCHFIPSILGNIYREDVLSKLTKSPCSNPTCHCHIGYIYMDELHLEALFQQGILERTPSQDWRTLPTIQPGEHWIDTESSSAIL